MLSVAKEKSATHVRRGKQYRFCFNAAWTLSAPIPPATFRERKSFERLSQWWFDFDRNCNVGAADLLSLLVNWGPCP